MTYDGKTSLQKALEQLHGKKLTFDDLSKITGAYRERLNLPTGKPISKAADKLKVYEWEREKLAAQSNLIELPAPNDLPENKTIDDNALPVTQSTTQKRNKTKRLERFNEFKRLSFNVTGNTQRQHISLEPEFIKALELIAPANRNQWLSDTVSDYIAKNGVESSTRIVKLSIVNELLKRAK